jgi:threonine-phosphate decarboxylase
LGHAWKRERLLKGVDEAQDLLVVVDEAYISFYPDEAERTVVAEAPSRKNLLVLRSVTKIFGIPGLRVGYAVASAEMVKLLKEFQNPWSVDSPSEAALLACLKEEEYLARTVEVVKEESKSLTERIWDIPGLRPVWPSKERPESAPPRPNWVLVSVVDTPWTSVKLHEALARRGVLARECSNFSGLEPGSVLTGADQEIPTNGHLRFAVRTPSENDKVVGLLAELMTSAPPKD